jgi:hypothetical protein
MSNCSLLPLLLFSAAAATAKAKHVVDTYTTTEGVVKAHIDNSVQKRVDALNAMLGEEQRDPLALVLAAAAAAAAAALKLPACLHC